MGGRLLPSVKGRGFPLQSVEPHLASQQRGLDTQGVVVPKRPSQGADWPEGAPLLAPCALMAQGQLSGGKRGCHLFPPPQCSARTLVRRACWRCRAPGCHHQRTVPCSCTSTGGGPGRAGSEHSLDGQHHPMEVGLVMGRGGGSAPWRPGQPGGSSWLPPIVCVSPDARGPYEHPVPEHRGGPRSP